ncbi:MAG: glycoside hydrolase family 2 protein [Gemmatimonadaceae bacterium]
MSLRRLLAAMTLALGAPLAAQQGAPTRAAADSIPLPEHPRPDFMRAGWENLNGRWSWRADPTDAGAAATWFARPLEGGREILVPFPWGSPLSGVPDTVEVAWYERTIVVPEAWRGRRVFLVVGASDWRTELWLDGAKVGEHEGGYTPFSVELTPGVRWGSPQRLTVRVDDKARPYKLEGKQGYGNARGLWQTVYLEARGAAPLENVHFTPRLARGVVTVDAQLHEPAARDLTLRLELTNREGRPVVTRAVRRGDTRIRFDVPLPNARLWSLEDPFLHEATVSVSGDGVAEDRVQTYFGMREFSVVNLPGTSIPYVALNGKPVFMQLTLDQAYHPQGYYTFPSDAFMRDEILRSRQIGLTGQRVHIKVEVPRKLYWADRLGVLIMADVPNWWGPPDSAAFRDHERALRGMIARDYNHPAIFSWILFNETWGLHTREGNREVYRPETQRRVAQVYRLAKSLDSTRLVEDNSVCCGRGHTETDLNTWHDYLAGWQWEERVRRVADSTFPGSGWNFEDPWTQGRQPMLNSEFGNVWGYEGSTGDVDWSWDYHMAVDAFRRHPKLAGWLYTEHHDVINEWNGYWRFDRSEKETGLGEIEDGMTLRDLHAPFYVALGPELGRRVRPGERVTVPMHASFLADAPPGDSLVLRTQTYYWNAVGERHELAASRRRLANRGWRTGPLDTLRLAMPAEPAVVVTTTRLEDAAGNVLHRNFTTFAVEAPTPDTIRMMADQGSGRLARLASVAASAYADARWSRKTWQVLDGLKVNGAGSGYFEYRIPFPKDLALKDVESAAFLVEASSKPLLGKDRDSTQRQEGDYMRGGGFHDPSRNPNAYPMTDGARNPSAVTVRVNGEVAGRVELADDPADHRGILSWIAQPRERPFRLHEAGTYGQLVRVAVPRAALERGAATGTLVVRLEVDEGLPGGLAVYGARFGRYPLDPTVAFILRDTAR